MKKLHHMVLVMLPGPFAGALGTLMFLLIMQFLMRYLRELVGKDLPLSVVLELVANNLAYMLVLAVPMAVLLAVISAFAKLSETGAYVVIRSAGIALPRLMWPVVVAGGVAMTGMLYFNNFTMPDANYRARGLMLDIRRQTPSFSLSEGVFFHIEKDYAIRAMSIDHSTGEMGDITVYDYTNGSRFRTSVNAATGTISMPEGKDLMELTLYDGEVHKYTTSPKNARVKERYERITFTKHYLPLDLSVLAFERSDPESVSRTERAMRTGPMLAMVDTMRMRGERTRAALRDVMDPFVENKTIQNEAPFSDTALIPDVLAGRESEDPQAADWSVPVVTLDTLTQNAIFDKAMRDARSRQTDIENLTSTINFNVSRADRYMVEVHKKFSIAVACLVFVLLGAPLVLLFKRGSLGFITALSGGIFVFYWVTLVLGEKFSDQGDLEPWIGMWAANIVIGICAAVLLVMGYRGQIRWPRMLTRSNVAVADRTSKS